MLLSKWNIAHQDLRLPAVGAIPARKQRPLSYVLIEERRLVALIGYYAWQFNLA